MSYSYWSMVIICNLILREAKIQGANIHRLCICVCWKGYNKDAQNMSEGLAIPLSFRIKYALLYHCKYSFYCKISYIRRYGVIFLSHWDKICHTFDEWFYIKENDWGYSIFFCNLYFPINLCFSNFVKILILP